MIDPFDLRKTHTAPRRRDPPFGGKVASGPIRETACRGMGLVEKGEGNLLILRTPKREAKSWTTVTSCAPGFLIVVFEGARQLIVYHEPYIRAINSHSKRIGRHHNGCRRREKVLLDPGALVAPQTGMISLSP